MILFLENYLFVKCILTLINKNVNNINEE